MQFNNVLIALSAIVALGMAQDFNGLPECARGCFMRSFPASGCASPADSVCLCSSALFGYEVKTCTQKACSPADQMATIVWSERACAAAGVPLQVGPPKN